MLRLIAVLGVLLASLHAQGQMVEVQDEAAPKTESPGAQKAGQYFQERKKAAPVASDEAFPRYLAVRIGTFFTSDGYLWGEGADQSNLGKLNVGVDYRLGEWVNAADLVLRIDYTNYELEEGPARKLSVGAAIMFPDANSRFPLYFGAGIGPGFFLKQLKDESVVVLDYSLFAGVRFLNVFDKVGFLVETGLKNHLNLFSDGQFNGIFVNVGSVFAF